MSGFVYDAAVLVAADRNERRLWAEHKARLELGVIPLVPAPVVAQVSRSPQQVQLRRFLTGCVIVAFGENEAHEAGRLLGRTRTADVVDAAVVTVALRNNAVILTSDMEYINRLATASGVKLLSLLSELSPSSGLITGSVVAGTHFEGEDLLHRNCGRWSAPQSGIRPVLGSAYPN